MKRLLSLFAIAVAVLVAAAFGFASVAAAEQAVSSQYITADYVAFGEIAAISASGDTVAVLHAKEGAAYLTVRGDYTRDVRLTLDPASLGNVHLAYYGGKVLLTLGGDFVTAYDCAADAWRDTNIPTPLVSTDEWGESVSTPLVHFAVDENGRVFVCYLTTLRWYTFEDIFSATRPDMKSIPMTLSPQGFAAHDGVCYFYSSSGVLFSVDTNSDTPIIGEMSTAGEFAGYDYLVDHLFLRAGAVVRGLGESDEVVIEAAAAGGSDGDRYLQAPVAMCTTFDGTDWRVYVADNGQSALKIYSGDFAYLGMYGTYGVDDGRLHAPTAVAHDKMTVINDYGNRRTVVLRDGVYTHFDGLATDVATVGDLVFVADDDEVVCYDFARPSSDAAYTSTVYYLPSVVRSVCAEESVVYALTADGVYALPFSAEVYIDVAATRVKAGRHAGIVYVQTASEIVEYKDGERVGAAIDVSALQTLDFDVDYCGNVYVLAQNGSLYVYTRTATGYLDADNIQVGVSALSIDEEGAVYALVDSALVVLNLEVRSRQNSAYPAPTWDDPVSVVKVEQSVWGYAYPNNYESLVRVPAGTYAMRMAKHTYLDTAYSYIEFALEVGGVERIERVYVPSANTTEVGYSEPHDYYVRYNDVSLSTGVYPYPSFSATAFAVLPKEDAVFEVLRIMGYEDDEMVWPWYMVRYNGRIGYIAAENYIAAEPPYREVERYYARLVAVKLGEKVAVYARPDLQSEVVATLVDGTKLELVAPYDADSQFTCIRLQDQEVYVLTANVTTRSLTNGQTFALIMSVVVICAAAVTLALYLLVKKRR